MTRIVECAYCGVRMPDRFMYDADPDDGWRCPDSIWACLRRRLIRDGATRDQADDAIQRGTWPSLAMRPISEAPA